MHQTSNKIDQIYQMYNLQWDLDLHLLLLQCRRMETQTNNNNLDLRFAESFQQTSLIYFTFKNV